MDPLQKKVRNKPVQTQFIMTLYSPRDCENVAFGALFSRQDAGAQRIREFRIFACFEALREIFPVLTLAA